MTYQVKNSAGRVVKEFDTLEQAENHANLQNMSSDFDTFYVTSVRK